jgi:hypothetical protein
VGAKEIQVMMGKFLRDEKIKDFINQWELAQETVLSEKIQLGDRDFYPLYEISVLYAKSGEITSASINPLLFLVLENGERYIILFDEEKMQDHENLFDLFDLIPEIEKKNK